MSSKSRIKITPEESAEFRSSVQGTKPLPQTKLALKPKPKAKPKLKKEIITDELSDFGTEADVSGEATISFARPGLQHKVIRKLKQGQWPIEAELDLHGMSSTQAKTALLQFMNYCKHHHYRFVSIIHGKSKHVAANHPILKNKLNQWLRQLNNVLAFHSAKPKHGGTGAVYVLLRI